MCFHIVGQVSSGSISRSGIAGLKDKYMCGIVRHGQTPLHRGCTIHFASPPAIYKSFHFPASQRVCCEAFFDDLMDEKWYVLIVFTCISLILSEGAIFENKESIEVLSKEVTRNKRSK